MRIRSLKPGFFKNEQLCELSPWHRLCYEGLWCCADRDGRLEDRPKRLKAEIFPYDDLDMNGLLWDLMHAGFIVRYQAPNLQPLIWIPSWHSHQFPRTDEADSKLPPFSAGQERTNGTQPTTLPSVRPIDTIPSLSSREDEASQQMGSGGLDLGIGNIALASAPRPPCRAQDLMELWNATVTPPIPKCRELTDKRRSQIRSRLARHSSLADWREAFEFVNGDEFHRGGGSRGWVVDFDYLIRNDTNVVKVLERARTAAPAKPKAEDFSAEVWSCPHTPRCPHRTACWVVSQRKVSA